MQLLQLFEVWAALQICPSSGLPCDCGAAASVEPGAVIHHRQRGQAEVRGLCPAQQARLRADLPSELRSRVAQPLELPGKRATWYR